MSKMGIQITICLSLFLLVLLVEASSKNVNDSLSEETRHSQTSGRIIKLYSETKSKPILCTGEGFQADPNDCSVFYRCVRSGNGKYSVFRFQCGPGTVYDPDTEVCNHPQRTKRSKCGSNGPFTNNNYNDINEIEEAQQELPSPISTKVPVYTERTTIAKVFASSSPITESSPGNTHSPNFYPSRATTKHQKLNISNSSTVHAWGTTSNRENIHNASMPQQETTSVPKQPSSHNVICTSDGFMGDSENCHKFYRCVGNQRGGYTKYEFSCSESTIWDDEIQACNHLWAVKRSRCGRSSGYNNKTTSLSNNLGMLLETISQDNQAIKDITDRTIHQQIQKGNDSKVSQNLIQISNGPVLQNQTQFKNGDRVDKTNNSLVIQNQTQINNGLAINNEISHENEVVQIQLQIDNSKQKNKKQSYELELTTKTTPINVQNFDKQHNMHENRIENNKCTESGLMGDPYDCKKFYRCVDNGRGSYTRHEFSCGEGTVWDSKMEACNHAWAVKECGEKVPTATAPQEFLNINTINYYTTSTKTTSSYNMASEITPIEDTDDIGYGNGNQFTTKSPTTAIKTTKTDTVQIKENECQASGFMGDMKDCKIFYRCVENEKGGYTKHEFTCGEGTLWDPDNEACNHAWAVKKCGGSVSVATEKVKTTTFIGTSKSPTSMLTTITTNPQSTMQTEKNNDYDTVYGLTSTKTNHNYYTTSEITPTEGINDIGYEHGNEHTATSAATDIKTSTTKVLHLMENECKSAGFMGDQKNCEIFYRCVENGKGGYTKYEYQCGKGTLWDPDIEACNHAWAVGKCGGSTLVIESEKVETTTTSGTTKTTTTALINFTTNSQSTIQIEQHDDDDTGYGSQNNELLSTTIKTTKQPEAQDHNLINECKSSGFMGDRQDCKKFYRCVDNGSGSYTRFEFTCGEGTVWDSKIEACNHEWAVENCRATELITTSEETSYHKPTTSHEEIYISHSTQIEIDTNNTTTNRVPSMTTINTTISEGNNKCIRNGFIGDSKDCKKFYRCVDNGDGSYTRHEFFCGEGTLWDQETEACNHDWGVKKCDSENEIAATEQITTSYHNLSINDEHIDNSYPVQYDDYFGQTTQNSIASSTTEIHTESNGHNNCKRNGFVGDRDDCKKFYRCVDDGKGGYIKYKFECGEGTVWDQSIEICNHAWAVKECGYKSSTIHIQTETTTLNESMLFTDHSTEKSTTLSAENKPENEIAAICKNEGFVGDKTDCKKFYRCVENGQGGFIKYEFSCGDETYWNQENKACDHTSLDQSCGEIESTTKESEHENDEIYTDSPTKSTSSSVDNVETSTAQISQDTCVSDGFYGDSNDCKKFYRCVDGGKGSYTKYDFACGDGTIWNQEIQACDHESSENKCSTTDNTTQTDGSQQEFSSTTTSTVEQQSTEKTNTSASSNNYECKYEGFYADPSNCIKFIRCVRKASGGYTKYEFSCAEGTVWVQDIQACDHDNGAINCSSQDGFTLKPQTTESHLSSTTASEINSSTFTTQPQTSDKENDEYYSESTKKPESSPEECLSEGFYANQNNCIFFYRCVGNGHGGYTKYDFSCGEGTAWDVDKQTCNYISEVKSCNTTNQQHNQTQPIMHDEELSQNTDGTSTTKASTSSESNESTSSTSNNICENEGYFGDTKNCQKFYRCVDDGKGSFVKHDYSCGEGTIWDQDITACNHPQDVVNPSCNQDQDDSSTSSTSDSWSTTSSTSSSDTAQSTISTTESSSQNSPNCSQEDTSKRPENKNITCNKAGYFADPNDCKKFYRCVDWDGDGKRFSVYYFDCGEGTIWDPAVETCNHEESVYPPRDCSGSQSQNASVESTTTRDTTTNQQSTTDEQTTTQQSTSTEKTTTQQATTSEQTITQQSTSSDQTTTQQYTSTEKPTTQQSSTSEQTTAQQSTSEPTTTQQLSTIEQTTTQSSTTTEQTTVQQSTSSEQTTTEQISSTEKSTQQTDSSASSTTEKSTTTVDNTTSDGISTEQSSTTQQTTTDRTSTPDSSNTEASTSATTQPIDASSTTENEQETTTKENSKQECPDTDENQYLFICPTSFKRHPKYCNLFYQCTEDDENHDAKIAIFKCPNNTIYDESKTQCVEADKADKKCDGEIAKRRRVKRLGANFKEPIVVTRESQTCSGVGHMPFETNSECSPAFLKCKKAKSGQLFGYVHQCPEGYIYWSISRRCERIQSVRDCKRTTNNWTGRWEIPIERNNVAW